MIDQIVSHKIGEKTNNVKIHKTNHNKLNSKHHTKNDVKKKQNAEGTENNRPNTKLPH
jgi:hypothetical protein